VLVSLLLGIYFSVIQMAVDSENGRRAMDSTFEHELKSFEESAFQVAFGFEIILGQTVVRDLF